MMKKHALAIAIALASSSLYANDNDVSVTPEIAAVAVPEMTAAEEQQAFGEQTAQSVKQVKKDPRKEVGSALKAFKSDVEQQLVDAGRNHMVTIVVGTAPVTVDKSSPDWARYRANAVRAAVADARQSHLQELNTSVRNSVITEFFADEGAPRPTAADFKNEDRFLGLLDKAIVLLESKVDSELREAGIDPEQFAAASPEIKQQLMRDHFAEQTVTEAFGDMSGMFVIKTFESYSDDGQGYVGVVLAKSAKKRDKIKALINSKGQVKADPARANPAFANVEAALSATDAPYLEYGTALEYDHNGYPMIISYGQAGVQYSSSERMMDKKRKAAIKQARANALANLAQTYNMSGSFVAKVIEQRTESQELVHKLAGTNSVESLDSGIVDSLRTIIDESARMTSSVNGLNGLRTVNEWSMQHPITGHEMVGLALVWHPIQVQNAEAIQSGRSAKQLDAEKSKKESTNVTTQQSKSRFNTDF